MSNITNRTSDNGVISATMRQMNGIGQSKIKSKSNSTTKGANGQNVSTKAHSIKAMENHRSVLTQYTKYLKEAEGSKASRTISNSTVKEFIERKIEEGLSKSSANTYISALGKIADNLNQIGIGTDRIDRETITKEIRADMIERHGSLQNQKIDRSNENPQAIINEINSNSSLGLYAELQLEAGLRAGDALNLDKLTLKSDNTIAIEGSKGGINYETNVISSELAERLKSAKEESLTGVSYTLYREVLKEAVESTGQTFNGTHSLRYDYANQKHENNLLEGKSEDESKAEISLNMGHSRIGITEHYLR